MRNKLLKSFALFVLLVTVFASCTNNNSNCNVVDLGLPSGVKWATCNVGAVNPWNRGNYYAWGEIQTKDDYRYETYKFCKAASITKYCNDAESGYNGFTDNLTTLLPKDDAATAVFGSDYSMPTIADWEELDCQCYWVWTETYNNHNVSGYIVYKAKSASDKGTKVYADGTPSASYSLSDTHIFLPAAGWFNKTSIDNVGQGGFYWSASLVENKPDYALHCAFSRIKVISNAEGMARIYGQPVRPVRRK